VNVVIELLKYINNDFVKEETVEAINKRNKLFNEHVLTLRKDIEELNDRIELDNKRKSKALFIIVSSTIVNLIIQLISISLYIKVSSAIVYVLLLQLVIWKKD
jgi:hypothetical protein